MLISLRVIGGVGVDIIPNGADEVELDWETKKNSYAEYVVDMERMKESKYIVSRSQFYNILCCSMVH